MKRRGSVLMEFIIVCPLIVLFVSAILQFSQIWMAREITAYAAFCACRSVLSAVSSREAERGAQRAAELACSWMCLAGLPDAVRDKKLTFSRVSIANLHNRRDVSQLTTIYDDNGVMLPGEIEIPGWGSIPGSDSSGSDDDNETHYGERWDPGVLRVNTTIVRACGYTPPVNQTTDRRHTWRNEDKTVKYALVRVKFKFPLMMPLVGRMVSWFADDDKRARTVDYGSHKLRGGSNRAWQGEEVVMNEHGEMVQRSSMSWAAFNQFPVLELTEYCMLPMPYSVEKGFGTDAKWYPELPRVNTL